MEALFYFALWAGLVFLMMRFGRGAHAMGYGQGRGQPGSLSRTGDASEFRWVPPAKDTDPVCKKTVATDKAKPSVYAGSVYYFCSRDCREVFEAAPGLYVSAGDASQQKLEHSHV